MGLFRYCSRTESLLRKNSALQTFSKDYELFVLPEHDLQRGLRSHRKLKKKYCVKRFTKDEGNYKHRPLLSSIKPNNQGCANPRCQVAVATKFCTVTPNLCGSRVNLLHITLLEPRIFWWILNFCCQRPYHVENIGSHPITAVKQRLAWLVPGEVTAWEHQALLARYFLHEVGQLVKSLRY